MLQRMLRDVSDLAAWAKSNWPDFLTYSGSVGLFFFGVTICLIVAALPMLIAWALAPGWIGVAAWATVPFWVVVAYLVSVYERSR